ncbi:exo-alpha-sialidase [Paludibacter sp.]
MEQAGKTRLILFFSFITFITSVAQDSNVRISWDFNTYQEQTSVFVSNKGYNETQHYYPRVKKLQDGSLLMVFMNDVVGFDIFIRKSYDNGKTWTDANMVRQRYSAPSSASPKDKMIFSTPDFIQLQDGQILLAYQWRYQKGYGDLDNTNQNCGIEIITSNDGGKMFSKPRVIYTGRCWEPAFLELPSGEIQLYITDSNEVMNKLSQPCVALLRSFDKGKTWQGKEIATYKDGEAISRTFDERGSYDGMPSAQYLHDNNGIAMSLEVWSSKFQVDETPVIVYSSNDKNWRYNEPVREKGGPEKVRKKQLNKDFRGFGPYMEILPTGEVLVQSNGVYKGEQGMWVFIGDKKADNFSYVSSPYEGYWGSIAYIGNDEVFSAGTYNYTVEDKKHSGIKMQKGKLNYAKKVKKGYLLLQSLKQFDDRVNQDWFIGKESSSSAYLNFGYTDDSFDFTAYLFDKKLIAYTSENADAVEFLLNRKDLISGKSDTYKFLMNANGVFTLKKEQTNSWISQDVSKVKDIMFNVSGTINNNTDDDEGFAAKVAVPWDLIGGKPSKNDTFRVHLRHRYKDNIEESPFASVESLSGEDDNKPETWLRISFE